MNEESEVKLENGKKPAGKPRVAGSKRGRELRAAAALARFEPKEPEIKDEELVTDSETESDYGFIIKQEPDDAIDINGLRLVDTNGRGMVKVCEDEDNDDDEVKKELLELQKVCQPSGQQLLVKAILKPLASAISRPSVSETTSQRPQPLVSKTVLKASKEAEFTNAASSSTTKEMEASGTFVELVAAQRTCNVCSFMNDQTVLTCTVCSNVIKPDFVVGSWRCSSSSCKNSAYINAGDSGRCGICAARKCS